MAYNTYLITGTAKNNTNPITALGSTAGVADYVLRALKSKGWDVYLNYFNWDSANSVYNFQFQANVDIQYFLDAIKSSFENDLNSLNGSAVDWLLGDSQFLNTNVTVYPVANNNITPPSTQVSENTGNNASAGTSSIPYDDNNDWYITVLKGDTLANVASDQDVTLANLMALNGITNPNQTLNIGDELRTYSPNLTGNKTPNVNPAKVAATNPSATTTPPKPKGQSINTTTMLIIGAVAIMLLKR